MHSAQTMFDLVADIAGYPEFLPGCSGADEDAAEAKRIEEAAQLKREEAARRAEEAEAKAKAADKAKTERAKANKLRADKAAAEIAQQAESLNLNLRMGIEPALAIATRDADWEAVLALSESAIIEGSSQHLGFLFRAWAMHNLGQNSASISVLEMLTKLLNEQGYSESKFINLFIYLCQKIDKYK